MFEALPFISGLQPWHSFPGKTQGVALGYLISPRWGMRAVRLQSNRNGVSRRVMRRQVIIESVNATPEASRPTARMEKRKTRKTRHRARGVGGNRSGWVSDKIHSDSLFILWSNTTCKTQWLGSGKSGWLGHSH